MAAKAMPLFKTMPRTEDSISYKVIGSLANGFGYDIYYRQQLFIHQASVPCVQGARGFRTAQDARKVALLVMNKIRKGMRPPAVSLTELTSMGVLH